MTPRARITVAFPAATHSTLAVTQFADADARPSARVATVPGNHRIGTPIGSVSEQEIGELTRQIAERGREGGRYHRKTGPEQFSREDWSNPDAELWW